MIRKDLAASRLSVFTKTTKLSLTVLSLAVIALVSAIGFGRTTTLVHADKGKDGRDLASLRTVSVPEPANLGRYIKNRSAAIALGKALFWDQQVGSDGQSCASCHFHAGADNRSKNQLNPGFRAIPSDHSFQLAGANYQLKASDFPLYKLADPNNRDSAVLSDTNDVVSSQGVRNFTFTGNGSGTSGTENGTSNPDADFSVTGINVRRVEPRNTPTVINTVFNYRNFWDGRARNEFNGRNPFGDLDPSAKLLRVTTPGQNPVEVQLGADASLRLDNSSAASQADGPPLSDLEMSYGNKTFQMLGRKMLGLTPLGTQLVATDDSVLGTPLSKSPLQGINGSYPQMIRDAFESEWWDSDRVIQINGNGSITILPAGTPLDDSKFTMMEYNFSLYWGLSIQLYEATLISDESPFDRYMEGDRSALTKQQEKGLGIFTGKGHCAECHNGAELTDAAVSSIEANGLTERAELADSSTEALRDVGFHNSGTRRINDDIGLGDNAPSGQPLSEARRAAGPGDTVAVNGTFKTPGLRNVELSGPFFHNGGEMTLRQVVQMYSRGGNFAEATLDKEIRKLGLSSGDIDAVVAFLKSLTDERVRMHSAPFDHPELIVPNGAIGTNTAVINDGTGNAIESKITLPAVGKNGLATAPKNFLQP